MLRLCLIGRAGTLSLRKGSRLSVRSVARPRPRPLTLLTCNGNDCQVSANRAEFGHRRKAER